MDNKEIDIDIENDPAILMRHAYMGENQLMTRETAVKKLEEYGLTEEDLEQAITVYNMDEYED